MADLLSPGFGSISSRFVIAIALLGKKRTFAAGVAATAEMRWLVGTERMFWSMLKLRLYPGLGPLISIPSFGVAYLVAVAKGRVSDLCVAP